MKPIYQFRTKNGTVQPVIVGVRFEQSDEPVFRGGVFYYQAGFKRRLFFDMEAVFCCDENTEMYRSTNGWHCVKTVLENGHKAIFEITRDEAEALRATHGENRANVAKIILSQHLRRAGANRSLIELNYNKTPKKN